MTQEIIKEIPNNQFVISWLRWFMNHASEERLSTELNDDIISKLQEDAKQYYDYEINEFRNDYETKDLIIKYLCKNPSRCSLSSDDLVSKKSIKDAINRLWDEWDDYDEVIEHIFDNISDERAWETEFDKYIYRRFLGGFDSLKKDKKRNLLKIQRSIAIPKKTFHPRNDDSSYDEHLDTYYDRIGTYWSFTDGGCCQFDDFGELKDNRIHLEIYGLINYEGIDRGSTFTQIASNFSSETEITVIPDASVEVYRVIATIDDKNYSILPKGKHYLIKA